MRIDYESMTDNELSEMYQLCAMEMEKRKTQEQAKDWEKAIEPLREYVKKYGLIIDGTLISYDTKKNGHPEIESINDNMFDETFYCDGPGVINTNW